MPKALVFIWEVMKIVAISLLIVIPVRYFVIQPFFVKGASMEPNFNDNQYLIIDELSYRLRTPERGEVIVFKYPEDPSQYYIKRIVGLPGETIEIVNGLVIVYNGENPGGKALEENRYLESGQKTLGNMRITLAYDEYFVLGDNRNVSSDSRRWGPLKKEYIIGRAWFRAWPAAKASFFAAPTY